MTTPPKEMTAISALESECDTLKAATSQHEANEALRRRQAARRDELNRPRLPSSTPANPGDPNAKSLNRLLHIDAASNVLDPNGGDYYLSFAFDVSR